MRYARWEQTIFTDLHADLAHKTPLDLPITGSRISQLHFFPNYIHFNPI